MSSAPQVFISYAREDGEQVFKLCDGLQARGVKLWVDKSKIRSGDWEKRIIQAVADSSYFLVCLSSMAVDKIENNSGFIGDEIIIALENYIHRADEPLLIVPAWLEPIDRRDDMLAVFQHYELFKGWEETLDSLADLFKHKPPAEETDTRVKPSKLLEALHDKVVELYRSRQSDNHKKALRLLDKIEGLEGESLRGLVHKGSILHALERHDEALAAFDRAGSINSDIAVLWLNKGIVLGDLKRYQESIEAYDRSLRIDPNQHIAWIKKSDMYMQLGNLDEALKSIEKAISLDGTEARAYAIRSTILNELGRHQESVEAADRALSFEPDLAEAFRSKGKALIALGDKENGRKCLKKAGDSAGINKGTLLSAANNLLHNNSPGEALLYYEVLLALEPTNLDALMGKFTALANLNLPEEALEVHEKMAALVPDSALARASKGLLLFAMGRHREALAAYDAALSLNPGFKFAVEGRQQVLEAMKLNKR